jgi:hypothetical protein
MKSPSSVLPPGAVRGAIRLQWTRALGARPRGLVLAREKGWPLVWDEKDGLHLLNQAGTHQAQSRTPGPLATACCAEDGSAYVALGKNGELWWLAPDLTIRWERTLARRAVAAALDPYGQYLAVADVEGYLFSFDRHARLLSQTQTPRPLHHLAFVPAAPYIVGAADYGLIACHDLAGRCSWRCGLVAHIGSLAVSGEGDQIVLACFTEGLQRYTLTGTDLGRSHLAEPCRLAALSFTGRHVLTVGLSPHLLLLDRKGYVLSEHPLDKPPVALALGPFGDYALAALLDGRVLGLDLSHAAPA